MKFCTQCHNMYYISIDEAGGNNLTYYCRFCGHKDKQLTEGGVVFLKTQNKTTATHQTCKYTVNKYTKHDPTLPRKKNMKCPNADCATGDVIYLRYDDENMKYLYICSTCDITWKTDDKK